ncbi:MAG: SAM-dependent methyltransferase [Myxococcales bacterium]|nr:SAM-dependent methyltransferase [Myxococcales bacterium]
MQDGKTSFTARLVSWARGVPMVTVTGRPPEALPGAASARARIPDPLAVDLIGSGLAASLRAFGRTPALAWAARFGSAGLVDHLHLRTAAIDRVVAEAVADGVRQIVLLGAGFDARAWRLEAMRGATVIEVDHPATQAAKRRQLQARAPLATNVVFAPVDFAKDSLADALDAAGHDPDLPTLWVWEGVTMYLPVEATLATVATLRARSAAASRLAVTYVTPRLLPLHASAAAATRRLFVAIGEPLLGAVTATQMRGRLGQHGFDVAQDGCNVDWARAQGGSARLAHLFRCERLAVAHAVPPHDRRGPAAPRQEDNLS